MEATPKIDYKEVMNTLRGAIRNNDLLYGSYLFSLLQTELEGDTEADPEIVDEVAIFLFHISRNVHPSWSLRSFVSKHLIKSVYTEVSTELAETINNFLFNLFKDSYDVTKNEFKFFGGVSKESVSMRFNLGESETHTMYVPFSPKEFYIDVMFIFNGISIDPAALFSEYSKPQLINQIKRSIASVSLGIIRKSPHIRGYSKITDSYSPNLDSEFNLLDLTQFLQAALLKKIKAAYDFSEKEKAYYTDLSSRHLTFINNNRDIKDDFKGRQDSETDS